jgi:hypothetical protein
MTLSQGGRNKKAQPLRKEQYLWPIISSVGMLVRM